MHKRPTADVAANVRAEMARQRMQQKPMADLTGITQATLSRRLTGVTPFTVVELEAVAHALGVRVSALLGEDVAA